MIKNLIGIGLVTAMLLGNPGTTQVAEGKTSSLQFNERLSQLHTPLGYLSDVPSQKLDLRLTQTVENASPERTEAQQNFPLVQEDTWLTEEDIPWSTPVFVKVGKEDKYLAVIDREYSAGLALDDIKESGIVSNWSRQWLRIYGYMTHQFCFRVVFVPVCNAHHHPVAVGSVQMKIGDSIFHLQGENSLFRVEDDLALALYKANQNSEPVLVQVTIPNIGDKVTRSIGKGTIKAWSVIYADALNATATAQTPNPSQHLAESASSLAQAQSLLRQEFGALPTVKDTEWRLHQNVPWSVPVLVKDEFEGDYVAVLDNNVQDVFLQDEKPGVVTNWGRDRLQVYGYVMRKSGSWQSFPVGQLTLQIGENTFILEGENNEFVINSALAQALRDAPLGKVSLSFFDPEGHKMTHPIGDGTVKSWQVLYRNIPTAEAQPQETPLEPTSPPAKSPEK